MLNLKQNSPWTGSAYSLYRCLLGAYLLVHFIQLLPWGGEVFSNQGMIASAEYSPLMNVLPNVLALTDNPIMVTILLLTGALAGVLLALGYRDKAAALAAALILAWLYQRNPLIANPSLPLVGWMLIAHLFVPAGPLGAVSDRSRGASLEWRLPRSIWLAAWAVLAIAYSYSGYTKLLSPSWVSGDTIAWVLENPLARDHILRDWILSLPDMVLKLLTWAVLYVELLFAPLILIRRLRPYLWGFMLLVQFGFLTFLNFADLTFPMLLIHMLTYDPRWLRHTEPVNAVLYFDGECGLCHRVVKFALAEDSSQRLRFHPLQDANIPAAVRVAWNPAEDEPFVLQDAEGNLYTKGAAVAKLLQLLNGFWRPLGWLMKLIPDRWLDAAYSLLGRSRQRLFRRPELLCPLVPDRLKSRFIA